MSSFRLGLEIRTDRLAAALLDDEDQPAAMASVTRSGSLADDLARLCGESGLVDGACVVEVGVAVHHLDFAAATPFALIRIGPDRHPRLRVGSQLTPELRALVIDGGHAVPGGFSMLGARLRPFDVDSLRAVVASSAVSGQTATFVLASTGAETDAADEHRAASVIREIIPEANVLCSSDFGGAGIREREHRTAFNAALRRPARNFVRELRNALRVAGVEAPPVFLRNTGGRVASEYFERYPITAVAAGRAAVQQGAVHLARPRGGAEVSPETLVVVDCQTNAFELAVLDRDRGAFPERRVARACETMWGGIDLEQPVVRRVPVLESQEYAQVLRGLEADYASGASRTVIFVGERADAGGTRHGAALDALTCSAAIGALFGGPQGEWQCVAVAGDHADLDATVLATRRRATSLAIGAGAGAADVVSVVQAQPVPYLPAGSYLIRARAEGRFAAHHMAARRPCADGPGGRP